MLNVPPASCCVVGGFMCTKPESEPPDAYNTVQYLAADIHLALLRETHMYMFLVSDESSCGSIDTQWTLVAMYLFHRFIDGYFIQYDSAQLKLTTVTTTKMCLRR